MGKKLVARTWDWRLPVRMHERTRGMHLTEASKNQPGSVEDRGAPRASGLHDPRYSSSSYSDGKGLISASDSPFLEHGRQYFDEKRHPDFRELPFHFLIGDLIPFNGPEMTTFSTDTERDIFKDGLEAVQERGAGKGPWQPENDLPDNPDFVILRG